MKYNYLFKPIKIGNVEVKNRFMIPAMGTEVGNPDGTVSDAMIEYYRQRAEGGYGLIVTEIMAVDPLGKANPNEPGLWDDSKIPGLQRLTSECHKYGAKMFVQLHHAGRQTGSPLIGTQPLAPSPIMCAALNETPREFTTEEVWELVEKHGDAAERVKRAGYDGVEIHCGHGYLLSQFMSAYANKRLDEFGGDITGRMKFIVEIIKNIRKKCGADFPIMAKMSVEERVYGGMTADESAAMAKIMEDAGLSAICVSTGIGGTPDSCRWVVAPQGAIPGYNIEACKRIKKAVSIPVGVCGRITDPAFAETIVADGIADMVTTGRASLADPAFPNKIAGDAVDEICPCISCVQGCVGFELGRVSCLVNPFLGVETKLIIENTDTAKNVTVVGAGPAGLEAAWLLAKKGHKVTLFEKDAEIGGQFRIASYPPCKQDIARFLKYQKTMCKKYGVDIRLNTVVDEELIAAEKPDAVVLATGGVPMMVDIKGIDGPNVLLANDVILGKVMFGMKTLVVGGGLVGVETADFLADLSRNVTIIEMRDNIAGDVHDFTRRFMMERYKNYDHEVQIITGAKVKEFVDDGVIYEKEGQELELRGFDSVIWASGAKSYNPLEGSLKEKVPELHVIGDANQVDKAVRAIYDAAEIAAKI